VRMSLRGLHLTMSVTTLAQLLLIFKKVCVYNCCVAKEKNAPHLGSEVNG